MGNYLSRIDLYTSKVIKFVHRMKKGELMEVYLDNSATTKPYKEVVDEMVVALTEDFGNPSSAYNRGLEVEKKIKSIRKNIAKTLGVEDKNIIFTSGGTEGNNSIIRSVASLNKKRRNHIITSSIEHPAVLRTVESLKDEGFEITILGVDEKGRINLEELKNSIKKNTALVSLMFVNNEVGIIEPIKEAASLIKKVDPEILLHTDAVQAYGKINFDVDDLNIDFMTVSAHKIHGPKGVGFMYIKNLNKFRPLLTGGGQESGIRPGTENVPGIYGLGCAVEVLFSDIDGNIKKMRENRNYLYKKISENIDRIRVNSDIENGVCHVLNISFEGVRGEVLLHYLEGDKIYVSTGSACSSKKKGSHVLNAIGLNYNQIDSAIRFSVSEFNTFEEIDFAVDRLKEYVKTIRLISKK